MPQGTTAADHGTSAGRRLTIGKVLAELSDEFPDVSASKIRFLEAEGLVSPHRTASGYRTYDERDLERLRYILAAQRDRFWPLRVIREALDALDRGLQDPGSGAMPRPPEPVADPDLPAPQDLLERRVLSLTGPELREATGIDRPTMHALETFGLLVPNASGRYDEHDVAVAAAARDLAAHGLEPRHLRPFRTAADREIGLIEQVLATRRADGTREQRAAEIAAACVALHVALVKGGLSR